MHGHAFFYYLHCPTVSTHLVSIRKPIVAHPEFPAVN
jgi:hypothetical protein